MATLALRRTEWGWARLALFAALATYSAIIFLGYSPWYLTHLGWDFAHYLDGARAWLAAGSPYSAASLAGPIEATATTMPFIHPPSALPLFAAFLVVPWPLWWIVPLAILGHALWTWQPRGWGLYAVALCALWPRTIQILEVGNSDLWVAAAIAAGLRWGWPALLIGIKPSAALFALVGVRHRGWWVALPLALLACVPFGALWFEWVTVVRNVWASGGYLLEALPLYALPVVAWGAGRRRPTALPTWGWRRRG